jgi:hypothetical protein
MHILHYCPYKCIVAYVIQEIHYVFEKTTQCYFGVINHIFDSRGNSDEVHYINDDHIVCEQEACSKSHEENTIF